MLRELGRPLRDELLEVVAASAELPLRPLPLRDVLEEGDEVVDGSVRRPDAADGEVDRDDRAVLADEAFLERVAVDLSADDALEPDNVFLEVVVVRQLRPGPRHELLPGVP